MEAPARPRLRPEVRLLMAVLVQAIEDVRQQPRKRGAKHAQGHKEAALEFLRSRDCEAFCVLLDVDYRQIQRWVARLGEGERHP
jgi:hypothetical protein